MELGHSYRRLWIKRGLETELPWNAMYVHLDPYHAPIAYTDYGRSAFGPAWAQHYGMDEKPAGSSHHLGKLIEHRDVSGKVMGQSEPRGRRVVEHSGELSLAHLTAGFILSMRGQYVNTG
jgi:hypothetical protein